jgi:hypothetical protein
MWLVKLNPDEQRFLSEGFPGFVGMHVLKTLSL